MSRQISGPRRATYYVGGILMLVGAISFGSTFVSFAMHFGDFDMDGAAFGKSMMLRAFGGIVLIIVGGAIRGIGAAGLAGSGAVLDPEQAREELEPYSRMAGGIVKDALDEADIHLGRGPPQKVVMIKCPSCGKLNEEDSKYCQECGRSL